MWRNRIDRNFFLRYVNAVIVLLWALPGNRGRNPARNHGKRKTEEPANNVKPLNKRDNIKVVKLDRSEIRENRPEDKLMLGTLLVGNETRREDQLDLPTSARAETANNVCKRHLDNKPAFEFHRYLHSFETGDLVLHDWPKQCDIKLLPMFKRPLMIVRPVGAVCYDGKPMKEQRTFRRIVQV
ncbi:hypothetical protein AVEN_191577-1, partial [Araneus ventricosus]